MRIFTNVRDAVREVERDLYELGIDVHPQTMQDKIVADDQDYSTKELQAYGFQMSGVTWDREDERWVVNYLIPKKDRLPVLDYILQEHLDRTSGQALNPGTSWEYRPEIWTEFLHGTPPRFSYTYSERMTPQLDRIVAELIGHPGTRQAIINIHSNIAAVDLIHLGLGGHLDKLTLSTRCQEAQDLLNTGGHARIPCSMYYQFLNRPHGLDIIYTMRSCDFLTHFPVDLMLAMRLQRYVADRVGRVTGRFTYFAGSLHAYNKDLKLREIF